MSAKCKATDGNANCPLYLIMGADGTDTEHIVDTVCRMMRVNRISADAILPDDGKRETRGGDLCITDPDEIQKYDWRSESRLNRPVYQVLIDAPEFIRAERMRKRGESQEFIERQIADDNEVYEKYEQTACHYYVIDSWNADDAVRAFVSLIVKKWPGVSDD